MERKINIEPFLNGEGQLTQLPQKQKVRQVLLAYLAGKFDPERMYNEREVNVICEDWHTFGDYFLLRRELVEHGLLCRKRDGSAYWRAPILTPEAETQPEAAAPAADVAP